MEVAMSAPTKLDPSELVRQVRALYRQVAQQPSAEFHCPLGRPLAERLGYPAALLDAVPAEALASFAGVGYALDLAGLVPGARVLDLGSGSGTDSFAAAYLVGPAGRVTGIDMTDEQRAKADRLRAGAGHVSFVDGRPAHRCLPRGPRIPVPHHPGAQRQPQQRGTRHHPRRSQELKERSAMAQKAVISLITGMEDPERVMIAFLVAVGAAEQGRPTLMFLTKEAVRLATTGIAVGVACEGCPPLPDLLDRFQQAGGRYLVCPICFNARKLDEGDLLKNAELGGTVPMWQWIGDEGATTFSH